MDRFRGDERFKLFPVLQNVPSIKRAELIVPIGYVFSCFLNFIRNVVQRSYLPFFRNGNIFEAIVWGVRIVGNESPKYVWEWLYEQHLPIWISPNETTDWVSLKAIVRTHLYYDR